jgi:uncharacterized protein (TIGR03083 family)
MSESHAISYRALRGRVRDLIESAEPAAMEGPSPATPSWTAHDVLAHIVGVTDDVVNGRLDGIATDAWTGAQVEARRSVPAAALLDEWDVNAPQFEQMIGSVPMEIAGQALFDAATHEHDIRCALGRPGARESDALALAWEWVVATRQTGGAPTIRFVTEHGDEVVGEGEPVATVKASRFEILRAITGRRSLSEMESYGWDPSCLPDLLIIADFFTMRPEPLNE